MVLLKSGKQCYFYRSFMRKWVFCVLMERKIRMLSFPWQQSAVFPEMVKCRVCLFLPEQDHLVVGRRVRSPGKIRLFQSCSPLTLRYQRQDSGSQAHYRNMSLIQHLGLFSAPLVAAAKKAKNWKALSPNWCEAASLSIVERRQLVPQRPRS